MEQRIERIAARCNEAERRALFSLARQDRRKPSEMLRELVRCEAKRRGVWAELAEYQAQTAA